MRTASASISASPATTRRGPASRAVPESTFTPSADSRDATSADWALARDWTLAYRRGASRRAAPFPALLRRMPRLAEPSSAAIIPDVAMRVLDGTQSVSTQAPPRPSRSTTVTSAPSWAATRAASYPPGPPPMIAILARGWLTLSNSVASGPEPRQRRRLGTCGRVSQQPPCPARTLVSRGDIRGLRQQYGPRADGAPLPAFSPGRHRLAGGVAADIRRRGPRLGGSSRHRRRGRWPPRLRRPVRSVRS